MRHVANANICACFFVHYNLVSGTIPFPVSEEADALAKASSENYSDPTDEIFGADELEV